MRRALLPALVLAAVAAGCASAPPPPVAVVTISNIAYTPATVTIHAGEAVRWDFRDSGILHHVMGDDGLDSGITGRGSYSHTFAEPGTYHYHCSVHTVMTGTVIVLPEAP